MSKLATQYLDRIPSEQHSRLDNNISACRQERRGQSRDGNIHLAGFVTYAPFIGLFTTFDAMPFALAAATTAKPTPDDERARWNRLSWAIFAALVLMGTLLIDGPLSVLQTASIVVGLPVLIVLWLGVTAFFLKYNHTGWRTKPSCSKDKEATHESR